MAIKTQSTVVAVFRSEADARSAVDDLKANGFSSNEIFVSSEAPASGDRATPARHAEGGVKEWFKHLFGSEDERDRPYREDQPYYEKAVNSGNCFVSVDVEEDSLDMAADVLNRHKPVDIQRATGETGKTRARRTTKQASGDAGTKSVPVVQEELQVGKRAVLRGGVRVYSRVVEEPVEENVRLREEHVHVERTPVNRASTEGDLRPGQERVFEVKEYAEEPVVSKMSRVVEDVRIRKDSTERTETVKDTVRRTEVDVENLADAGVRARAVDDVRSVPQTSGPKSGSEDDFRRNYSEQYGAGAEGYDAYAPAYRYGYDMAGDARYRGRNFDEVEPDLRNEYASRYPNSTWERMKDSVRYGWDKLTRKV